MKIEDMRDNAGQAVSLLKSMSNLHRLMILCMLHDNELSVGALNEQLDLSQSALSQHLAWLRREGLVSTRRDAQTIYYSLASKEATQIIATLHGLYCSE